MDMTGVSSSNISAYGYSPETKVLRVSFANGGSYDYAGVPADVVEEFVKAQSKGGFLAKNIRGKFEHSRVEQHD